MVGDRDGLEPGQGLASDPHLNVAVNLSARSLMSMDISMRLGGVLKQIGLEPSALTLELTESSAMADPQTSNECCTGSANWGSTSRLTITAQAFRPSAAEAFAVPRAENRPVICQGNDPRQGR